MQIKKYLYRFGYDPTEQALSQLESKYIFNTEDHNKLLFSDIKIEPSSSAFLKSRLDIISFSEDYSTLIQEIKKEEIHIEDFKIEYIVLGGDTTEYDQRLEKLRDIGYSIEGTPDYHHPKNTYALCFYNGIWCFGLYIKNKYDWHKHKEKPHSYSNSISIHIAKALVNIAAKGNKEKILLDACCGVGTIILEACFAGYNIEGCDINWKICRNARENISYFNYQSIIYRADIKDIQKRYDTIIIDLPYNLLSTASDKDVLHIIESSSRITDRLIIVSTSDITAFIHNVNFDIVDFCQIGKRGKRKFSRKIWVCIKNKKVN